MKSSFWLMARKCTFVLSGVLMFLSKLVKQSAFQMKVCKHPVFGGWHISLQHIFRKTGQSDKLFKVTVIRAGQCAPLLTSINLQWVMLRQCWARLLVVSFLTLLFWSSEQGRKRLECHVWHTYLRTTQRLKISSAGRCDSGTFSGNGHEDGCDSGGVCVWGGYSVLLSGQDAEHA